MPEQSSPPSVSPVGARGPLAASMSSPRAVLCLVVLGAFVLSLVQGRRVFNFVDTTYLLETIHRLSMGDVPYRDFFLVLPPLHYYLNWAFFELSGGHAGSVVVFGAAVSSATVLLTFFLLRRHGVPLGAAAIFASCAAFSGPFDLGTSGYDAEAVLFCLASLWTWDGRRPPAVATRSLVAGALGGLAILTKINIGVPYLLGLVLVSCLDSRYGGMSRFRDVLSLLAGIAVVIAVFCAVLDGAGALSSFLHQTLVFPAQKRLSFFHNLLRSLPVPGRWYQFRLTMLSWFPTLWLIWGLAFRSTFRILRKKADGMDLLPVPMMGVLLGGMQSQVDGSLYGQGAIAALALGAGYLVSARARSVHLDVAMTICTVVYVGGHLVSGAMLERLYFIGEQRTLCRPFSLPKFEGLRGYGPAVSSLELAVRWTRTNVAETEKVFAWPGMSPFYLASGRRCPLPSFQVLGDTGMSPAAAIKALGSEKVEWVYIDLSSRVVRLLGDLGSVQAEFDSQYTYHTTLGEWKIYRRRHVTG